MSGMCRCMRGGYSLVRASKRIPRKEIQVLIELRDYTANIPIRALEIHLPGFYNSASRIANRRISPMAWIAPLLTNFNEFDQYELALSWIFLHVTKYYPPQCLCRPWPAIPQFDNPLELLNQIVITADNQGDGVTAMQRLRDALLVFQSIGALLRPEFFGCGPQILSAYCQAASQLAALLISAEQGPHPLYELVSGVALVCKNDRGTIQNIFSTFPLNERYDLANYCTQLEQAGDFSAHAICRLLQ